MLYASEGFPEDAELIQQVREDTGAYQVVRQGEHYYIQTGIMVNVLNRNLYLETMEDVTEVFAERAMGFSVYRQVTLAMLSVCAVVMFIISFWLTKPIRLSGGSHQKDGGGRLQLPRPGCEQR